MPTKPPAHGAEKSNTGQQTYFFHRYTPLPNILPVRSGADRIAAPIRPAGRDGSDHNLVPATCFSPVKVLVASLYPGPIIFIGQEGSDTDADRYRMPGEKRM